MRNGSERKSRTPGLQSAFLKFHRTLAAGLSSDQLIFLNYGFKDHGRAQYGWIRRGERRHKYHLRLVQHVLRGLDLNSKTVLEVGSGRGGNCSYLARYTDAERIYGIDLCQENVRFCQKTHGLPNVTFLPGDAQELPFRSGTFDVVLSVESSHCYPDFERFLSEVRRVLKQSGYFCLADLWGLDILPIDWNRRKEALASSKLTLLYEEDISEQVFQALRSDDGLSAILRTVEDRGNKQLVDRLVRELRAVRFALAAMQCYYRAWRFQKP